MLVLQQHLEHFVVGVFLVDLNLAKIPIQCCREFPEILVLLGVVDHHIQFFIQGEGVRVFNTLQGTLPMDNGMHQLPFGMFHHGPGRNLKTIPIFVFIRNVLHDCVFTDHLEALK